MAAHTSVTTHFASAPVRSSRRHCQFLQNCRFSFKKWLKRILIANYKYTQEDISPTDKKFHCQNILLSPSPTPALNKHFQIGQYRSHPEEGKLHISDMHKMTKRSDLVWRFWNTKASQFIMYVLYSFIQIYQLAMMQTKPERSFDRLHLNWKRHKNRGSVSQSSLSLLLQQQIALPYILYLLC